MEQTITHTKDRLLDKLVEAAQPLPEDKILVALDFVGYLQSKYSTRRPERGSAEAILEALERVGPLQFEPGELDQLLAEIEQMRLMDFEEHG